jgi:hypothetical protein
VDPERTEEQIATAMARADRRVCVGSDRCFALPHRLEDALVSCMLKGRCMVGWIVIRGGRESWDVKLEVNTGLVKRILGECVTTESLVFSARATLCRFRGGRDDG